MTRAITRQSAALLGLIVLLPYLAGCYNTQVLRVAPPPAEESPLGNVVGVTTIDNQEVPFARSGEVRDETVYGTIETRSATGTVLTPYEIAVSQVARLWLEERELEWARLFTGVAVIAGAILAVLIDPAD